MKKSSPASAGTLFKPGKKPKLIVHAAGDVGISGDGYRWRKYGQKMVKGNPQPRCTLVFHFFNFTQDNVVLLLDIIHLSLLASYPVI